MSTCKFIHAEKAGDIFLFKYLSLTILIKNYSTKYPIQVVIFLGKRI